MTIPRVHRLLLPLLVLALLTPSPVAHAATGDMDQLGGTDACVSDDGTSALCENGSGLEFARAVTVSPDAKNVYVASGNSNTVVTLTRNTSTGALDELASTGGSGMDGARSVAVSADGKNVYVATGFSSAVAVFARDKATGALTQLPGTDGCVSETGSPCETGRGLLNAESVVVTRDGKHVYVASGGGNSVAAFKRDKKTGALDQPAGTDACVSDNGSDGCVDGRGLNAPFSIAASPDGKTVYVASGVSGAISVFKRNKKTGVLEQLAGTSGCISETGSDGCGNGDGLADIEAVTVSSDGKNVYSVADGSQDAVAAFARDKKTGALTQLGGTDACISETGASPCDTGIALLGARAVAVSTDGNTVYVASGDSDAVAAFSRNTSTGGLTQLTGLEACVSEDGTTGLCENDIALDRPEGVAVSPENASVYVASGDSNAVAAFSRET